MERQLTEGRPFGVLLRYALPVLGGNLFQLFYTLFSRFLAPLPFRFLLALY